MSQSLKSKINYDLRFYYNGNDHWCAAIGISTLYLCDQGLSYIYGQALHRRSYHRLEVSDLPLPGTEPSAVVKLVKLNENNGRYQYFVAKDQLQHVIIYGGVVYFPDSIREALGTMAILRIRITRL